MTTKGLSMKNNVRVLSNNNVLLHDDSYEVDEDDENEEI
jgi:hypothetical protein